MDAIQGVSLPRSGHNLLVSHLQKYFDSRTVCRCSRKMRFPFWANSKTDWASQPEQPPGKFHYCEFYYSCRTHPCLTADNTFQKSHDFDLDLPCDPARKYIIQTRNHPGLLISWFELRLKKNRECDSPEGFNEFAKRKLGYLEAFREKWFNNRLKNCLRLDYDDYLSRPAELLGDVVQFFDENSPVNRSRISRIVADVRPAKDNREFRFFDESLPTLTC